MHHHTQEEHRKILLEKITCMDSKTSKKILNKKGTLSLGIETMTKQLPLTADLYSENLG